MNVTDTPREDVEYVEVIDDSKEVKTEPEKKLSFEEWQRTDMDKAFLEKDSTYLFLRSKEKTRRFVEREMWNGSGLKYKNAV